MVHDMDQSVSMAADNISTRNFTVPKLFETKYRYRFNSLMLDLGWPLRVSYPRQNLDRFSGGSLKLNRLWYWGGWVLAFYTVWLALVFQSGQWQAVQENWPIAFSMALGSYAAGSTPMGGGTIGFPVLVMLFDMPASLGRDFSFAIQSIGMTSATIFIFVRRQPLAWAMLSGAMLGTLIGTPLGVLFIAPIVPGLWVKVLFAIIWASFGVLHLLRVKQFSSFTGVTDLGERWDFRVGFGIALVSSLFISSVTGVGIDMMLYCALVLLCRSDLKIAIPTSVVIMAFTSLVATAVKGSIGDFQEGVYGYWLAAAPIVVLGAPLGVFIANKIGREITIYTVALLCIGQYLWLCWDEFQSLQLSGVIIATAGVILFLMGFELLRRLGEGLLVKPVAKRDSR